MVRAWLQTCAVVAVLVSAGAAARAQTVTLLDVRPTAVDAVELFGLSDRARPGFIPTKSAPEVPFPYLPDEPAERSFSIGTVTDGYVVGAAPLPSPGPTWGVLPRQLGRGLVWGTTELLSTLTFAADRVAARYPGTVLWLGNIGARGGGDIPWSVSHNAGRDADLAFYTTDPAGRHVQPPDLLHYGRDGRSREYGGYYRFDVARNWALVEALLASPHAEIQFLFISNPLRALLLEHGERVGADPAVVARARQVLRQPGPEIPHDDHLHLRLYCGRADLGAGCEDTGAPGPNAAARSGALRARAELAASLLRQGDAETRARAVERLGLLRATAHVEQVRRRLSDPSPWVRAQAVDALARIGVAGTARWLADHWEDEDDPLVRERLLRAVAELGGDDAIALVDRALRRPVVGRVAGKPYDLRHAAVGAAERLAHPALVAGLLALVADPDPWLAARAVDALRVVTNHDAEAPDPLRPGSDAAVREAMWRGLTEQFAGRTRRELLEAGFAAAGYGLAGDRLGRASTLADAAGDRRRWVRINAQRELMRVTGNPARSLEWSASDARLYWTRWVRRNPGRVASL